MMVLCWSTRHIKVARAKVLKHTWPFGFEGKWRWQWPSLVGLDSGCLFHAQRGDFNTGTNPRTGGHQPTGFSGNPNAAKVQLLFRLDRSSGMSLSLSSGWSRTFSSRKTHGVLSLVLRNAAQTYVNAEMVTAERTVRLVDWSPTGPKRGSSRQSCCRTPLQVPPSCWCHWLARSSSLTACSATR